MMGDPGPSDIPALPSVFGNQRGHEFPGQVLPISGLQASVPTSSTDLYPPPLPYFQPLDHHPYVSFRQVGYEEWSHRASQLASGPSSGHHDEREEHVHGRSSHSGDTLDLMSRARVEEAGSSRTLSDDLLTYPEGEDDAVTITTRDLEGLQPGRFLSGNIIDFYIKYLNMTILSQESQRRFHFFNNFFFTRLIESTTSMGFDQCKVDYEQLRNWIGEVNLFEKDYVFIPIVERSHWSLIVICHLRSLNPSALGELKDTPCILHLDPVEGKHECYEGQVRSFILQAWMERMRIVENVDLLHVLVQMKYVQAKVPQQDNNYDCGVYILHYIEVFLLKSTSQHLTLSSCERGIFFTNPNFGVEVFNKRGCIEQLIFKLVGMVQVHNGSHLGLEGMRQQEVGFVYPPKHNQRKGLPKLVKEGKSQKWKEVETLILLECMVAGGRFHRGKRGVVHWDRVVEEVQKKKNGGLPRSKEQCQNRFDTLKKAYEKLNAYCVEMRKEFCDVMEDEKESLKLATPLKKKHEVWYKHLHTICKQRPPSKGKSSKRHKFNLDGDIDVSKHVSSPLQPSRQSSPSLYLLGSSKSTNPWSSHFVVKEFNGLNVALKYTFFNLIQAWAFNVMWERYTWAVNYQEVLSLEGLCRMLAIVQDQNPLEIRNHVYQLQALKLVTFVDVDSNEHEPGNCWMERKWIEISNVEVSKKLGRKVLSNNPDWNTFHNLTKNDVLATKPCPLQHIRVLILYESPELEIVDLGDFPHLRFLKIMHCAKLKVVNGWEGAKGLGWIHIWNCPSYRDIPHLQFLSSLKEFCIQKHGERIAWGIANFSQCVQLRRLEINMDDDLGQGMESMDCDLVESMDLKALRFLEVLSFGGCRALSTIHGLRGLKTLIKLSVFWCRSLKMIPDLGCLKALTYLDMSGSGIVEIPGIEELHLLTWLGLCCCDLLESLPPLGHLKVLAYLNVSESSIEEIPGVEDLVSLEILDCRASKLRRLPNLEHLCLLREIDIRETPLIRMDPTRSVIRRHELIGNDISDVSVISDMNDSEED